MKRKRERRNEKEKGKQKGKKVRKGADNRYGCAGRGVKVCGFFCAFLNLYRIGGATSI